MVSSGRDTWKPNWAQSADGTSSTALTTPLVARPSASGPLKPDLAPQLEKLRVDVRLISATNRDIESLLADGRLREDLYYQINTLTVRTPALRDRSPDIPPLARHFLEAACRRNHWKKRAISPEALEVLRQQPWKGNVRELRTVLERALILSAADPIGAAELRAALSSSAGPKLPVGGHPLRPAARSASGWTPSSATSSGTACAAWAAT